jgi:hypothetical protein
MEKEVSHAEIYARLMLVEEKVDRIDRNTEGVVAAFQAASGAFLVLETLGKLAKPILYMGSLCVAATIYWQAMKDHFK